MLKKKPEILAKFTSGSNSKVATLLYKACPSIHVHIHVYAYVLDSKNLHLCVKALVSDFVQYFSGHLTKYSITLILYANEILKQAFFTVIFSWTIKIYLNTKFEYLSRYLPSIVGHFHLKINIR